MCVYIPTLPPPNTHPQRHSANWSKKSYILPVSGGHKAQNTYAIQAPLGFSNEEVTVAEHKKEDSDYPNFVLILGTQYFPRTEYQICMTSHVYYLKREWHFLNDDIFMIMHTTSKVLIQYPTTGKQSLLVCNTAMYTYIISGQSLHVAKICPSVSEH